MGPFAVTVAPTCDRVRCQRSNAQTGRWKRCLPLAFVLPASERMLLPSYSMRTKAVAVVPFIKYHIEMSAESSIMRIGLANCPRTQR